MAVRAFIICALAAHGLGLRTSAEVKETLNSTTTGITCSATGYEAMLEKENQHDQVFVLGKNTAILVVDVQKGFTVNGMERVSENGEDKQLEGGFAQPCLDKEAAHVGKDIHERVISTIVEAINEVKEKGGLVVATKDYHPLDHCSFWGQKDCENSRDAANLYAKKAGDEYKKNRYVNEFPAHCVGTIEGKVKSGESADWATNPSFTYDPNAPHVPRQSETMLHPQITDAMKDYKRSHVAYKGFSRDYDSFGAFPMKGEPKRNKNKVGAKLWLDEKGQARKFSDEQNPPVTDINDFLNGPTTSSRKFSALEDFLLEQEIKQVLVVGYVYDFCVKDTAIGAVQHKFDTTVLTGGSRPAGDGIQNPDGSFGIKAVTDSGRDESEKIALGSEEASLKASQHMRLNGVKQTFSLTKYTWKTRAQIAEEKHMARIRGA